MLRRNLSGVLRGQKTRSYYCQIMFRVISLLFCLVAIPIGCGSLRANIWIFNYVFWLVTATASYLAIDLGRTLAIKLKKRGFSSYAAKPLAFITTFLIVAIIAPISGTLLAIGNYTQARIASEAGSVAIISLLIASLASAYSLFRINLEDENSHRPVSQSNKWPILALCWMVSGVAGYMVHSSRDTTPAKPASATPTPTPTSLSNETMPPFLRQGGGGIRYLEDTTGPRSGWFELFNGEVEARELIRGEKSSIVAELIFKYDILKDTYILYQKDPETYWKEVPLKKKWFQAEFTNDARGITLRLYSNIWEYHVVNESTSIHLECKGKSGAVAVFTHRLQKNNPLSDLW